MSSDEADELEYICGACKQSRQREDVEMVADPDPQYGEYPLCKDNPNCTIEEVARRRGGGSDFRIDEPLE